VTILDPKVVTLYWRIEDKTTEFYLPWYSKDKIDSDMLLKVLLILLDTWLKLYYELMKIIIFALKV